MAIKKWILGTLAALALAAGVFSFSHANYQAERHVIVDSAAVMTFY